MAWSDSSFSKVILIVVWILLENVLCEDSPPTAFLELPTWQQTEMMGNTKLYICRANGQPAPLYSLMKDGQFTDRNLTMMTKRIEPVTRSSAGVYVCVSANTLGALMSRQIPLSVGYMGNFATNSAAATSVNIGQAYVIDLPKLDTYPPLTPAVVVWYKDTEEIRDDRYYMSLKFQLAVLEARSTDSGSQFMAKIQNVYAASGEDFFKVSPSLTLHVIGADVGSVAPSVVIAPADTSVIAERGTPALFECVINAKPISELSITWYRRTGPSTRVPLSNGVRYLTDNSGRRLTIREPVEADSGVYECEGRLSQSVGANYPPVTQAANLTVLVSPKITNFAATKTSADHGDKMELPCTTSGVPSPVVRWYRNAVLLTITPGSRFSQSANGSLVIVGLQPPDAGVYQCFAQNPAGEVDGATWLRVLSSPASIVRAPQAQTVITGQDIRLICDTQGAPKPEIIWKRLNNAGESMISSGGRFSILTTGELVITGAETDDSGTYICLVTNPTGSDSKSAIVQVSIRTVIDKPPQNTNVIMGSTAVLNCGVQKSLGILVQVSWYLNDKLVSDARMTTKPDGSLEIQSVRTSDIGQYKCEVTSAAGNDTKSAQLTVVELPYPPSGVKAEINKLSDQKVDISWSPGFDGHSPIKYYIIQYRMLPPGQDLGETEGWVTLVTDISNDTRTYTVTNLKPANSYQFHVSAVNGVGEGQPSLPSGSVTLPQQAPSGPPRGVVASPRTNSSILVQWSPPEEGTWNGPLQGYIIRYKPYGYPSNTFQFQNVSYPAQIIELTSLIVFQEYTVEVAAFNAKGAGVYSNTFRVRTKEGYPTAPPQEVDALALNSTCVKVRFLPPNPQQINGINQGYKLLAKAGANTVTAVQPPDPANMYGQQMGVIRSLKKYTEYAITVVCYTSAGDGPPSPAKIVRTLENTPDQVENMRFEDVYDTSLKVVWDPPLNVNGVLEGYSLIYGLKNQSSGQLTKTLDPSVTQFIITSLTEQTVYTITVYARTRIGAGVPQTSDIKSGEKPELPGPPTSLALSNYQARSVVVQFMPGDSGKTTILKWVVEAQVGSSADWEKIFEQKAPNARSLVVDNLRPFTVYALRMYAVNIVGRSDNSKATVKFQTIQDVPSVAPGNVTVRALNETAITVRWTPLPKSEWNGEPIGYKIEYRDDLSDSSTASLQVLLANSNGNGYVLTGLEEWTTYSIRLLAYNAVGDGDYSPEVKATTREAVPSAGPATVDATTTSSSSIQVVWTNVPLSQRNGLILGYKVLYGSQEIGMASVTQTVTGNDTLSTFLRNLRKFVTYQIQVLAFTSIGDGVPSPVVPLSVQTSQDIPGPPSSIYFPYVTYTRAQVVWSPPLQPNGVITGYSIGYREQNQAMDPNSLDDSLDATRREYTVTGLKEQRTYVFMLRAKTAGPGWGITAEVLVKTILDRKAPSAPSIPTIGRSEVAARTVTLSWQPGDDGYGPVRNYTIQYSLDNGQSWTNHVPPVPAEQTSYTVTGLKPDKAYTFRVAAGNDIGLGMFSAASVMIRTLEDVPDSSPLNLKVTPITTTSIVVQWQEPPAETWNGALLGYHLYYRQLGNEDHQSLTTPRTDAQLTNLTRGVNYEVKVSAYNSMGAGPETPPHTVYVGEAIPAAPPSEIKVNEVLDTEVVLTWQPPPLDKQNGALLGYKVYYWIVGPGVQQQQQSRRKRDVVPPPNATMIAVTSSETHIKLENLRMFTQYNAVVVAFNPAGDGPPGTFIAFTTKEGVPDAPGPLVFRNIMMTSVNVSWSPPANPNGRILNYGITYKPLQDTSVSFTVNARVDGNQNYYAAVGLGENVAYSFNVTARTVVGWGQSSVGEVKTGPQPMSPEAPGKPVLTSYSNSVSLTWTRGDDKGSPITAHIVEALSPNTTWSIVAQSEGPRAEVVLPFSTLKSKTSYNFHVRAMNANGVSPPSPDSDLFTTPATEVKPIYEESWFLVIVALIAVIIIIVTVFTFMLLGRNRRAKADKQKNLAGPATIDEGGFPTFELHQPRANAQNNQKQNGSLGKQKLKDVYVKSPPRPSPASVTYGEDDDDLKPPLPSSDHSSTVSEKPSDLDSFTEPPGSDSEEETDHYGARGGPPPFVSPYLSDHKLWKSNHLPPQHQRPPPSLPGHGGPGGPGYAAGVGNKAYSYTDSEPESYQVSLHNGQHKYLNNHAGSRAPLPGFSSFV